VLQVAAVPRTTRVEYTQPNPCCLGTSHHHSSLTPHSLADVGQVSVRQAHH
jgi:hypothetical protein